MKSLPEDLALLQRCGEALWGHDWRPALRLEFGIIPKTTRRWMSGEAIVPRSLWRALSDHMRWKSASLSKLADLIDASLEPE